jgi:hypothetical protein
LLRIHILVELSSDYDKYNLNESNIPEKMGRWYKNFRKKEPMNGGILTRI